MSSILFSTRVRKKLEKNQNFLKFFLVSGKSHSAKKCKRGLFGSPQQSLTKPNKTCTKMFGHGRDSNPRPSAWQTSKILKKIRRRSYISVTVSGSQLIKLKICHFVGLKKRKVTAIVCVFYGKHRQKSHCYSLRFLR